MIEENGGEGRRGDFFEPFCLVQFLGEQNSFSSILCSSSILEGSGGKKYFKYIDTNIFIYLLNLKL